MVTKFCTSPCSAKLKARSGFTLVELLVVIGIIAILAGVALGPITNGIKKAKQSSALQSAHAIGISMYAAANDNNQKYPYPASGTSSSDYAKTLLAGGYVTDPSIFMVGSGGARTAFTGLPSAATGGTFTASNVAWDFVGAGAAGASTLDSTATQYLPIMWTTVGGGTAVIPTNFQGTGDITSTPAKSAPFGTDGMAIFYINNASKFVVSTLNGTTPQVVMVPSNSNSGEASALAGVIVFPGGA